MERKKRRMWWGAGALLGFAVVLWGVLGCGKEIDPWAGEPEGAKRVVVSIPPLYSFVRAVGGDHVAIRCICSTTGPHHYTPDTRDARVLSRADLFLAVGLTLDDSFSGSMRSMAHRADLRFVKVGDRLPKKSLLELKHTHDHAHGGDDHHHHGKWDPHVWLGLDEAIALVEVIRSELTEIDPDHAGEYKANAEAYTKALGKLHEDGKALLKDVKGRRIISFHEALGYFAHSFNLEIADVIEPGAGDEPTAAHLARLTQLCQDKDKPIAAITVEPQYPKTSSAKVIQSELSGKGVSIPLVEIDPLETADLAQLQKEGSSWYETRMRENLQALAKALK